MKKIFSVLFSLLALHAMADNRLYINDFSIDPDETVDVSIMLDNEVTDFASFQADMYLPEGLELVEQYNEEDDEYFTFSLTTRARSRMAIGSAVQADGAVRLMLTQTMGSSVQTIKDASGALVNFQVKAAANANGTKYINLRNIVFSTATSVRYPLDDTQTTVTVNSTTPVTGISLNNTALTLTAAGQTATLTATVTPSNATNKNVTWASSNTAVATVNNSGVVTAVADGTAVITATTTDGTNLSAQCSVTVSIPVPATGISLNNTTLTLTAVGQTATLTATVTPSNATNKNVTWTSSNTAVATVSNTGEVTAVADGTAVITATTADGTNLSAQCNVTVSIPVITNIIFDDDNVKALCVANWDTNNDGELSTDEAASITSIGTVFKGNTQITSFNELQYFTKIKSIGVDAFNGCSNLTSINIPEGVTSISQYAFRNCSSLTSIIIPEGVTSIGSSAFYGCSSLTSINIPEGVTSIGSSAFYGCSSLTSINIPEGVTSIGGSAFYGCSSLTSIIIPEGVTSIGSYAFNGCSSLTSINIPEGVTSIENGTFYGCSNLTSINIPEGVTSIGGSAFRNCSCLISINIPEGVTSIGNSAFSGCSGLTSINIPEGVTSIENYAFQFCSRLISVIANNKTPVSIESGTFSNRKNATLYVPYGSKAAYEVADYWKEFKEIIELEGDVEKCAKPTISYANGKLTFASETEGVEFVSKVTVADANSYNSNEITLTTTYHVIVYATKAGYANSDITTADINVKGSTGDVNGDGNISIADVTALVNIILGKAE